tara:strand:- start:236 stop:856 length:621 start_codon:yes stop_codon:yes gene_type:complete
MDSSNKKLAWVKNLKDKENPNDKKMTPKGLALKLINMTPLKEGDFVLDGFSGKDAFYSQYPSYVKKDWCEIDRGKDFFKWNKKVDWTGPTNPPYSQIQKVLEHSCKISNKGIAFLIGMINMSPKRVKMLEDNGFGITHFHICNVRGWFGKSLFFIAEKGKTNIITYDPFYYKMPPDEQNAYVKKQKEYQHKYYVKNFKGKKILFRE